MKSRNGLKPNRRAALVLLALTTASWAQEPAKPPEVKVMCPAVIATVMVGKVSCSAPLCNTGTGQAGWLGLAAQIANRRSNSIDGASFSAGVGAQLATALKQTGCFTVVDSVSLEETRKELEALGRPLPAPTTVDFLVRSDITKADLVVNESSFLGFSSRTAKSSLGLDTKLVSASSGTVSAAGIYDAVTEAKSSGVAIAGYRSGDDSRNRATPFTEVSIELVVKAAMGLTSQILALPAPSRPSPAGVPQQAPVPAEAAASSAPQ